MSVQDNVASCIESRKLAVGVTGKVLKGFQNGSEADLRDNLQKALAEQQTLLPSGWYSPPPSGIGILFTDGKGMERSKFPTLREEAYWPNHKYKNSVEGISMIYASPVHKSGIIADFGFTIYNGHDQKIKDHLRLCLDTLEEIANHVSVGMQFRELNQFGQNLFAERELNNQWLTTTHNPLGTTLGHTVPWTHELPTESEAATIKHGNMNELKNVISHKRLYIDRAETFVIPETVAFTVESQLASNEHPDLPNVFFHLIVAFAKGEKRVLSNFNPIFDTLGIDYMRSRF